MSTEGISAQTQTYKSYPTKWGVLLTGRMKFFPIRFLLFSRISSRSSISFLTLGLLRIYCSRVCGKKYINFMLYNKSKNADIFFSFFLFLPLTPLSIPQFSHRWHAWVLIFFCLQLFLTSIPQPRIKLTAELHQT